MSYLMRGNYRYNNNARNQMNCNSYSECECGRNHNHSHHTPAECIRNEYECTQHSGNDCACDRNNCNNCSCEKNNGNDCSCEMSNSNDCSCERSNISDCSCKKNSCNDCSCDNCARRATDFQPVCQDTWQQPCDNLCSLSIAMAYVPWQKYTELYPLDKALRAGTIFPCLDKPFIGKGGCC